MKEKLFFLFFLLCLHFHSVHALEVVILSCEMSESPLTVTETFPRFGWQIVSEENGTYQTAYAIELCEWKNGEYGTKKTCLRPGVKKLSFALPQQRIG
jgi:hypothetical protein